MAEETKEICSNLGDLAGGGGGKPQQCPNCHPPGAHNEKKSSSLLEKFSSTSGRGRERMVDVEEAKISPLKSVPVY